jgi:hypothetical protein
VLAEHRSFGRNDDVFANFPEDVDWYRAAFTADEVLDVLYIKWDWWLRITDGTRRPRDAARRIRGGLVAGVEPDAGDELIARAGRTNPARIAVRVSETEPVVLLEGHVRLTAYALFPQYLPPELELYLGESPEMGGWGMY